MSITIRRRASTAAARLLETVHAVAPGVVLGESDVAGLLIDPPQLRRLLENRLGAEVRRILITGTLDRRLLLLESDPDSWIAADLSGEPHGSRQWPYWFEGHLSLHHRDRWLSPAELDDYVVNRLSRPHLLLAALYHPEFFPLPRFPLGISDVARAARSTLLGQVTLTDMQLGVDLEQLRHQIVNEAPDVLGISATFGQHDLMTSLLDTVYGLDEPPLVVAGGSLTARNEELLLHTYPDLLIARGAGEATIRGVLAHWHGDIDIHQVPGLGFNGAARGAGTMMISRRRRTAKPVSAAQADIQPELDLLPTTLDHLGVAQLEASRGCTNYCSFCPRGHKGQWFGGQPDSFGWILKELREVFDRYPAVSRTLYLVDEEFIGRGADAVDRALRMARTVHKAGFRWETSCRIDQVVHPTQNDDWHRERAQMWRTLLNYGLRRCLFGVESGVDSILERFNKETTGEQNAMAIRTLSALGIPTRFTYITFDPLMTFDELKATHAFQGRTDLLLRPMPDASVQEIVEGVRDPQWVAQASTGRPLHTGISYMLVSMECLIGAAYTKRAQAAGLTGAVHPSMGRQDARYADWRIGLASHGAQLWIDRNFALDYTLKSLEKILDGEPRRSVRGARVVLKDAAYTILSRMITAIGEADVADMSAHGGLQTRIGDMMQSELEALVARMSPVVDEVTGLVPGEQARLLHHEHDRWATNQKWRLINAADPCGT
jgi:hypothetical protein